MLAVDSGYHPTSSAADRRRPVPASERTRWHRGRPSRLLHAPAVGRRPVQAAVRPAGRRGPQR